MDELLAGTVQALGRGLRFLFVGLWLQMEARQAIGHALRHLFYEVLFQTILFNLGRGLLLTITLGRFPRGKATCHHAALIEGTGLLAVIGAWMAIALYNTPT